MEIGKKNYKINRFFGSNEFSASYVITNIWAFKLTPNHNDIAVFDQTRLPVLNWQPGAYQLINPQMKFDLADIARSANANTHTHISLKLNEPEAFPMF